jgi:hypothetical protein
MWSVHEYAAVARVSRKTEGGERKTGKREEEKRRIPRMVAIKQEIEIFYDSSPK